MSEMNFDQEQEQMKTLVEVLKDIPSEVIMYYIHSRRDDIVVVQWYSLEHIRDIAGCDCDLETIRENIDQVRDYIQHDFMMETCGDHLSDMSSHASDFELEALFDLDDEEE